MHTALSETMYSRKMHDALGVTCLGQGNHDVPRYEDLGAYRYSVSSCPSLNYIGFPSPESPIAALLY